MNFAIISTPPFISTSNPSIMVNVALLASGFENTVNIMVTTALHASICEGMMGTTLLAYDNVDMLFGPFSKNIIDISFMVVDFMNIGIFAITLTVVNHSTGMFMGVGTTATSIFTNELIMSPALLLWVLTLL